MNGTVNLRTPRFALNQTGVRPAIWLVVGLLLCVPSARAHKPSDTYLQLRIAGTNITGQWEISQRDLEQALGLGGFDIVTLKPGELQTRRENLAEDTLTRLQVKLDGVASPLRITDTLTSNHLAGEYALLQFTVPASRPPQIIEVDCHAFFNLDPQQRGLLRLEAGGRIQTGVFHFQQPVQRFELARPDLLGQWLAFTNEGIWHIWSGTDHILFLLALLLPAVLRSDGKSWAGVDRLRPAFINVLKIVTAFTVAHSFTLTLAALNVVQLPSRLVESTIALSVALAAGNNLYPWFRERGWIVAFGFGLIHGFGFASTLADLGLAHGSLAVRLVGFNVGVELGQLAIVSVFLPLAFALRRSWFYQTLTLKAGSAAVILIALTWLCERLFDLKVFEFLARRFRG